jgi:hypothetical protein
MTASDTGSVRVGETDVIGSDMVPTITYLHAVESTDSTFDQTGEGTLEAAWTITGTDSSGDPFTLSRSNIYATTDDIAAESFYEIQKNLYSLFYNPFETVEFTGVDVTATVEKTPRIERVDDILVKKDGEYVDAGRTIRVQKGSTIRLRLVMDPEVGSAYNIDVALDVPDHARHDGYIKVKGGKRYGRSYCFYDPDYCVPRTGDGVDSVQDLIDRIESKRRNDLLTVKLFLGSGKARDKESLVLDGFVSARVNEINVVVE